MACSDSSDPSCAHADLYLPSLLTEINYKQLSSTSSPTAIRAGFCPCSRITYGFSNKVPITDSLLLSLQETKWTWPDFHMENWVRGFTVLGVKINIKKQTKTSFSPTTKKTYLEVEKNMINQESVIPVLWPTSKLDWINAEVAWCLAAGWG